MSIGALAARFGLAAHVLRHWESMGLLRPVRDMGGRRRYGADDLIRVATILVFKKAGIGLDTTRSLSATADRATRHEILRPEAEELRSKIAAARASLELQELHHRALRERHSVSAIAAKNSNGSIQETAASSIVPRISSKSSTPVISPSR
ncbi:MerR family transcriptional regulator [Streptomyces sp. NPDC018031]|uniref:MerR family transcriptional regulator n=1 Tax=Streptomyces sp. NPDC018031 TaxID=3365033 RepID=UPI0037AD55A0